MKNDAFPQSSAMTPEARKLHLQLIGEAMFGPEWISPLAAIAGINLRTMQRWAAEAGATPSVEGLDAVRRRVALRLQPTIGDLEGRLIILRAEQGAAYPSDSWTATQQPRRAHQE